MSQWHWVSVPNTHQIIQKLVLNGTASLFYPTVYYQDSSAIVLSGIFDFIWINNWKVSDVWQWMESFRCQTLVWDSRKQRFVDLKSIVVSFHPIFHLQKIISVIVYIYNFQWFRTPPQLTCSTPVYIFQKKFNGSQLAKIKKYIPCPSHKIIIG